jgi:hypothetical protein
MKEILLNESYKRWLNQYSIITGVDIPIELSLVLAVSWLEHAGIFIIPQRDINGWVCKIEDTSLVPLSPLSTFKAQKTRNQAIDQALYIVHGILR